MGGRRQPEAAQTATFGLAPGSSGCPSTWQTGFGLDATGPVDKSIVQVTACLGAGWPFGRAFLAIQSTVRRGQQLIDALTILRE
jgi:hypothetical protein